MNTKFLLLGALALGGAMVLGGGGGKTKTITVTKKIPVPVKLPDMGEYHTQEKPKLIKKTVVYNFKFPNITTPSLPPPPKAPSLSDFVQHVFPTFTSDPNVHVKFTPTMSDNIPSNVVFQDSGAEEGYQTSPYVKKKINQVAQEHPNKAVIVHSQPVSIPKKKLPDLNFSPPSWSNF